MKFEFGKNWISYSKKALNQKRLIRAREDFISLLPDTQIRKKEFLDVGFGQGLALFLAQELGAHVYGIDVDPECLIALKATSQYFPNQKLPEVEIGSILDSDLITRLIERGKFDIVHSWGVLHHTGNMKNALHNAARLVKPGGYLIVALYNKHWSSRFWLTVKRIYNRGPWWIKKMLIFLFYFPIYVGAFIKLRGKVSNLYRGMDFYHDLVDWIGGYPYEYISKKEVVSLLGPSFRLVKSISPVAPTSNNQLVFKNISFA